MATDFEYERRQYDRLFHQTRVRVISEAQEALIASTVNLSNGGLLLKCQFKSAPSLGEIMHIQALDFPDAPVKKAIIRRVSEPDELGVEFIE